QLQAITATLHTITEPGTFSFLRPQQDEGAVGRSLLSAETQAGPRPRRRAPLSGDALVKNTLEDVDAADNLRRRSPSPRPDQAWIMGHLPPAETGSAIHITTINRQVNIMARK